MKRTMRLLCLLTIAALLPCALRMSGRLPVDTHAYIEKKYAGWSGVLRAWVCARWDADGDLMRWLRACGNAFEKRHSGVYLEFRRVSVEQLRDWQNADARPPELLFFAPTEMACSAALAALDAPDSLRADLKRDVHALPVALSGYICLENSASEGEGTLCPPDDEAHCFSLALAQIETPQADADALPVEPGVDLGLPASAQSGADANAAERFKRGDAATLLASPRELKQMIRLRNRGSSVEWRCGNGSAFTDQILLAALPIPDGTDAAARGALAEAFVRFLFTEDAQEGLSDTCAVGVTGAAVHSAFSAYAPLERFLLGQSLRTPNWFSEY